MSAFGRSDSQQLHHCPARQQHHYHHQQQPPQQWEEEDGMLEDYDVVDSDSDGSFHSEGEELAEYWDPYCEYNH